MTAPTTTPLDRPVKVTTFQGVSLRRKITNNVATVLVTLSVLIALIPLLWVLYSVVAKGIRVIASPDWFWYSFPMCSSSSRSISGSCWWVL